MSASLINAYIVKVGDHWELIIEIIPQALILGKYKYKNFAQQALSRLTLRKEGVRK